MPVVLAALGVGTTTDHALVCGDSGGSIGEGRAADTDALFVLAVVATQGIGRVAGIHAGSGSTARCPHISMGEQWWVALMLTAAAGCTCTHMPLGEGK